MKLYPDRSLYSREELDRRKRQLSAKKGQVTRVKNALEQVEREVKEIDSKIIQAHTTLDQAKKAYQETEKYKQYILLQARATEEYAEYNRAADRIHQLEIISDSMDSRLEKAEKDASIAHEELEKAQKDFDAFLELYQQVNNPMTYSEMLKDQLGEVRRNQEQVRQEMQNWSRISSATSIFGFMLIIVAAILLFTSAGQGNLALLSGVVGGITLGASRLAFVQYNDAKKRFDVFSLRSENLHRELMGLKREDDSPNTAPKPDEVPKGSMPTDDNNDIAKNSEQS